tara:strand:+ start:2277 stop:3137 length:861 start_codon:yes stop_codon:yes gene_type:complete
MKQFYFTVALITCIVFIGNSQSEKSLNIVSWNVFLRPGILNDNQMGRVDNISTYLISTDADVLVLQEVFHKKARKSLLKKLTPAYKFRSRIGKRSFWGVSSGVVILSKHQITQEEQVSFKKATGSDKMAKKGAVSAVIQFYNSKIQVIGTHLQAGGGKKRRNIRKSQIKQLQSLEDSTAVTSLYVGDFNIENASDSYIAMMVTLDCVNDEIKGENKTTSNFSDQELFPTSGKSKWIDFILLKKWHAKSKEKVRYKKSKIESPKFLKKGRISRLSDHNPIHSSLIIE